MDDIEKIHMLEMELREYKKVNAQLLESEKKYRELFENSRDAMMTLTPPLWKFTDANKAALELFGVENVSEFTQLNPLDISSEQQPDGSNSNEKMQKVIEIAKHKGSNFFEWENKRIDGKVFSADVLITSFGDGLQVTVRDITDRKCTEQALRESNEKLHSITASAQDAIIMIDNEGNISYWNEAAEKIFGYFAKDVMGWSLHELITPERFLEAHYKAFEHFKKTGEGAAIGATLELAALKKDATEFPIELSLSAVLINGEWNAIGIIRDITERKKMQEEVKHKDEMMIAQAKQVAMGDMISMIAHQWRQPLAVIGMDANNLRASIELDEEITTDTLLSHTELLNEEVDKLAKTIENFSNYFKPNQLKEQTTIEDVLIGSIDIIGSSLKNNNIALNIHNTAKTSLFIIKSSLIQVLLNILGNAKEMFHANQTEQATININADETEDRITISICDNAGGISESIIDKIGQPYFTTKQSLNDTGLGLYVSKTIIEKHLFGTLTWHNKDDGACFVITLMIKHADDLNPTT
jgi:PAS domain S-box-containing protein